MIQAVYNILRFSMHFPMLKQCITVPCRYEPRHDKTNKVNVHPAKTQRLIRVSAVRSMGSSGPKLSSCGQRRLSSDWADAHADLRLRWAHTHFVGFS